jgi:23S rRNA A2030 N6-methylase RlmJ
MANFTDMLSHEMWIEILSYLNQKELCTLSEVDSKFYRLARDPAVWRKGGG